MDAAGPIARLLLYCGAAIAIGRGTLTFLDAEVVGESSTAQAGVVGVVRGPVEIALCAGAFSLIVAPLLLLWLQQHALELAWPEVGSLLRDTAWGRGWTQLAIACAATAIVLPMRATRTSSLLLVMAALGVAVAMGGLGHAAADEQWPLASRLFDAMHVAGMGAWIGGLLLMVLAGSSARQPSEAEWQRYSRTATVMAPVTILSGIGSGWRRLGAASPVDIIASDYGRLLLLKACVVLAIVALGYSQRKRLAGESTVAPSAVQREVALALAVLTLTALLTGLEPPSS